MTKRKCLREHYFPHLETYHQFGRGFRFFDYLTTVHYCHFCNKIRVQRKIYFNKLNILKKKDNKIPF